MFVVDQDNYSIGGITVNVHPVPRRTRAHKIPTLKDQLPPPNPTLYPKRCGAHDGTPRLRTPRISSSIPQPRPPNHKQPRHPYKLSKLDLRSSPREVRHTFVSQEAYQERKRFCEEGFIFGVQQGIEAVASFVEAGGTIDADTIASLMGGENPFLADSAIAARQPEYHELSHGKDPLGPYPPAAGDKVMRDGDGSVVAAAPDELGGGTEGLPPMSARQTLPPSDHTALDKRVGLNPTSSNDLPRVPLVSDDSSSLPHVDQHKQSVQDSADGAAESGGHIKNDLDSNSGPAETAAGAVGETAERNGGGGACGDNDGRVHEEAVSQDDALQNNSIGGSGVDGASGEGGVGAVGGEAGGARGDGGTAMPANEPLRSSCDEATAQTTTGTDLGTTTGTDLGTTTVSGSGVEASTSHAPPVTDQAQRPSSLPEDNEGTGRPNSHMSPEENQQRPFPGNAGEVEESLQGDERGAMEPLSLGPSGARTYQQRRLTQSQPNLSLSFSGDRPRVPDVYMNNIHPMEPWSSAYLEETTGQENDPFSWINRDWVPSQTAEAAGLSSVMSTPAVQRALKKETALRRAERKWTSLRPTIASAEGCNGPGVSRTGARGGFSVAGLSRLTACNHCGRGALNPRDVLSGTVGMDGTSRSRVTPGTEYDAEMLAECRNFVLYANQALDMAQMATTSDPTPNTHRTNVVCDLLNRFPLDDNGVLATFLDRLRREVFDSIFAGLSRPSESNTDGSNENSAPDSTEIKMRLPYFEKTRMLMDEVASLKKHTTRLENLLEEERMLRGEQQHQLKTQLRQLSDISSEHMVQESFRTWRITNLRVRLKRAIRAKEELTNKLNTMTDHNKVLSEKLYHYRSKLSGFDSTRETMNKLGELIETQRRNSLVVFSEDGPDARPPLHTGAQSGPRPRMSQAGVSSGAQAQVASGMSQSQSQAQPQEERGVPPRCTTCHDPLPPCPKCHPSTLSPTARPRAISVGSDVSDSLFMPTHHNGVQKRALGNWIRMGLAKAIHRAATPVSPSPELRPSSPRIRATTRSPRGSPALGVARTPLPRARIALSGASSPALLSGIRQRRGTPGLGPSMSSPHMSPQHSPRMSAQATIVSPTLHASPGGGFELSVTRSSRMTSPGSPRAVSRNALSPSSPRTRASWAGPEPPALTFPQADGTDDVLLGGGVSNGDRPFRKVSHTVLGLPEASGPGSPRISPRSQDDTHAGTAPTAAATATATATAPTADPTQPSGDSQPKDVHPRNFLPRRARFAQHSHSMFALQTGGREGADGVDGGLAGVREGGSVPDPSALAAGQKLTPRGRSATLGAEPESSIQPLLMSFRDENGASGLVPDFPSDAVPTPRTPVPPGGAADMLHTPKRKTRASSVTTAMLPSGVQLSSPKSLAQQVKQLQFTPCAYTLPLYWKIFLKRETLSEGNRLTPKAFYDLSAGLIRAKIDLDKKGEAGVGGLQNYVCEYFVMKYGLRKLAEEKLLKFALFLFDPLNGSDPRARWLTRLAGLDAPCPSVVWKSLTVIIEAASAGNKKFWTKFQDPFAPVVVDADWVRSNSMPILAGLIGAERAQAAFESMLERLSSGEETGLLDEVLDVVSSAVFNAKKKTTAKIEKLYEKYDTTHDGFVTFDEFAGIVKDLVPGTSWRDISTLFVKITEVGDHLSVQDLITLVFNDPLFLASPSRRDSVMYLAGEGAPI